MTHFSEKEIKYLYSFSLGDMEEEFIQSLVENSSFLTLSKFIKRINKRRKYDKSK